MVNAYATGRMKRLPPSHFEEYNTVRQDLQNVCQVVKDMQQTNKQMLQKLVSNTSVTQSNRQMLQTFGNQQQTVIFNSPPQISKTKDILVQNHVDEPPYVYADEPFAANQLVKLVQVDQISYPCPSHVDPTTDSAADQSMQL